MNIASSRLPNRSSLYVEIGKGRVEVQRHHAPRPRPLDIEGRDADEVTVTFEGNRLSVIGPKDGGELVQRSRPRPPGRGRRCPPTATWPVKTGSADIEVEGQVNEARIKTGSGDVTCDTFTGAAQVDTGSGDVEVAEALAELRVKSGSGDISVGTCLGDAQRLDRLRRRRGRHHERQHRRQDRLRRPQGRHRQRRHLAVHRQRRPHRRHRPPRPRQPKGASSDLRIGIPAGTPVWADINTVTGSVRSNIESVGAPQEGQEHVELQARTVSGDIALPRSDHPSTPHAHEPEPEGAPP